MNTELIIVAGMMLSFILGAWVTQRTQQGKSIVPSLPQAVEIGEPEPQPEIPKGRPLV